MADTGRSSQRTLKFIRNAKELIINRKQSGVGVLKINGQNREQTGDTLDSNKNPGGLRVRKKQWEYRRKGKPTVYYHKSIGKQI